MGRREPGLYPRRSCGLPDPRIRAAGNSARCRSSCALATHVRHCECGTCEYGTAKRTRRAITAVLAVSASGSEQYISSLNSFILLFTQKNLSYRTSWWGRSRPPQSSRQFPAIDCKCCNCEIMKQNCAAMQHNPYHCHRHFRRFGGRRNALHGNCHGQLADPGVSGAVGRNGDHPHLTHPPRAAFPMERYARGRCISVCARLVREGQFTQ